MTFTSVNHMASDQVKEQIT